MWLACNILFFVLILLVAYCYVLFPLFMTVRSRGKQNNQEQFVLSDDLPEVAVVMAVYNEEEVIEQKLQSIFATTYPLEKIQVFIGSDNSTDATHSIIEKYIHPQPPKGGFRSSEIDLNNSTSTEQKSPLGNRACELSAANLGVKNIHLKIYSQRQGKPAIINDLVTQTNADVLILTDANVYFEPETIFELTKHYKNPHIGLVGALIVNTNIKKTGISYQEKTYLSLENKVKYAEGVLGGAMIGAFGGAFSLRNELYKTVPPNFIVDDFYITMQVLKQDKQCILEPSAVVYEDVANVPAEEFRRKVRISTGNYQNLREFRSLIRFNTVGFYFFSHKILRWITPFFLTGIFIFAGIMAFQSKVFLAIFITLFLSRVALLVDFALKKLGIHSRLLRFISHFYQMNFALLLGFFKYIKGVQSNVWQPTKRNQN
ncbi:MAG: glycosyltransferase [Bacteroidetes bacterium]|nr:glycosyltransferase [Bacteroidota bacterium]